VLYHVAGALDEMHGTDEQEPEWTQRISQAGISCRFGTNDLEGTLRENQV